MKQPSPPKRRRWFLTISNMILLIVWDYENGRLTFVIDQAAKESSIIAQDAVPVVVRYSW